MTWFRSFSISSPRRSRRSPIGRNRPTVVKLYRRRPKDQRGKEGNVNWVPTFGGHLLGCVRTSIVIAVVLPLLAVIALLALALKMQFEDSEQDDKNLPPRL